MTYFSGSTAESWFQGFARRARVLASPPPLAEVLAALRQHVPQRMARYRQFIEDPQDPNEWLDGCLKTDVLLNIEDIEGKALLVAVDVTLFSGQISAELGVLRSREFRLTREALGIKKHWIVLLDDQQFPSEGRLLDSLYMKVDEPTEVDLIDWT